MRLLLSRLTAVLVIGIALWALPGVAVVRVGGREGTARMAARGGLHRLSASEAVVHGYDDTAPDDAARGDLVSNAAGLSDAGTLPPAVLPAAAAVSPPSPNSARLPAHPLVTLHSADAFLRPLGRAPPAR